MKIHELIVNQLLEALQRGAPRWDYPWEGALPRNLRTRRPYRGMNFLLLLAVSHAKGYRYPWWLTFQQVKELGGSVKKGEKGTRIVFWKWLEKNAPECEEEEACEEKIERYPVLRYYIVFNVSQTTLKAGNLRSQNTGEHQEAIRCASKIVKTLGIRIINVSDNPSYIPSRDVISMPPIRLAKEVPEWWASLFHEIVHWSGTEKRLRRKSFLHYEENSAFRAMEEMVAEIGAEMLLAHCGFSLSCKTFQRGKRYILEWAREFPERKMAIIRAAAQAQKAVDFILGYGRKK